MKILTTMEKLVLKAFIDSHNRINDPQFVVELMNVKLPKGMNGPQKLEIIKSLRSKGLFQEKKQGASGISPFEHLTQEALDYFA